MLSCNTYREEDFVGYGMVFMVFRSWYRLFITFVMFSFLFWKAFWTPR